MKRIHSISSLITVISLLLGVIWLSPAVALAAPSFASLGQIKADGLRVPGAMDLDAAGNLYVADARGGKVHKFSPYGELLQSFDLQATGRGLAVTPDGARLFVSRGTAVAIVEAASGLELGVLAGGAVDAPEFGVAGEIDLDAAGNIYVADAGEMKIKIYDASGRYVSRFGGVGPADGQFLQIGGMAINPTGQVVVADTSALNGKVHVFTIGTDLSVLGVVTYPNQSAANFGAPIMYAPRGLAFDAQGRAFLLEFISSQVRVASASFASLGAYSQPGYQVGQLNNVTDVIFDKVNSRLFVGCDTGRIEILAVDGGGNPVPANNAPPTPDGLKPTGGEVNSTTPTLSFNGVVDADGGPAAVSYRVVVMLDGQVVTTMTTGETSVAVNYVLSENAAYTWTVEAFDGADYSAASTPGAFIVNAVDDAPSAPELLSPANGALIDGAGVLTWGISVDPDPNDKQISYLVEIAADDLFAELVASETTLDTAINLGVFANYGDLVDGAPYAWRVTALDPDGTPSEANVGQFVYDTTVLKIACNMPDAEVFLGGNLAFYGRKVGVAPLELRDVTAGVTSVVVTHKGFEPYVAQVVIDERQNVEHYAALVPAMVTEQLVWKRNGLNWTVDGLPVDEMDLSVAGMAVPFIVDFNSDGQLDMLVGDKDGHLTLFPSMLALPRIAPVKVFFQEGISFNEALPVLPNAVPFVVDWNNDGLKDLIVGVEDGTVHLFTNNGTENLPTFDAGILIENANGVPLDFGRRAAPAVVDYNGDGRKDLLVGNAQGTVFLCYNSGTDEDPMFGSKKTLIEVGRPVVPFSVDWNADGKQELLLTSSGVITVYAKTADGYVPVYEVEQGAAYVAAFPFDFNGGKGKEMLVGRGQGDMRLLTAGSDSYVPSFRFAMLDKVDELAALVDAESPNLSSDVARIRNMANRSDFAAVAGAVDALKLNLQAAGPAQSCAQELADICK